MEPAQQLINRFSEYIITPAIFLVFTAGFFLFVWGLVQFLWNLEESSSREEGKRHMLWGIIGMFVMVAVYGIIQLLDTTFDLDIGNPDINRAQNLQIVPGDFFGGS